MRELISVVLPANRSGSLLRRLGKLSRKFPAGPIDRIAQSCVRSLGAARGRSESRLYLLPASKMSPVPNEIGAAKRSGSRQLFEISPIKGD
jgi:hypothetical protein